MGTTNAVNPPPAPRPTEEVLWKQYELHVKLYKHYLSLVLKFNIFYYAVTGAVLSFYFTNSVDVGVSRYWLLAFPILMSLGYAVFFFWAASRVQYSRLDVMAIVNALGLRVFPEMHILTCLLILSGILFTTVALGLLAIICHTAHR